MDAALPTPHLWSNLSTGMNVATLLLLLVGYVAIKRRKIVQHKRAMTAVLVCSALFLSAYLYGHALHGSTRYPVHDWSYTLYLLILVPHSLLAIAILPFILRGVWLIGRNRPDAHARLMRRVWPVWIYISGTGILVYLMLYVVPRLRDVPHSP